MLPFLARACDRLLTAWLAGKVRPPHDYQPPSGEALDSPDAIALPGPIQPTFTNPNKDGISDFQVPSPVPSAWKESQIIHGQAMGPAGARSAVVVLHGAYGEYRPCQMLGYSFTKHGFRVLIPAAPCHQQRTPQGAPSGAALFWSTKSVVLGVGQWLAEVHGLIQGLRAQGAERVGIIGYSIGSLSAGLAASLWPDLDFVALLAPVGHHLQAIRHKGVAASLWPWMKHVSPAEAALLDRWAPINRPRVVNRLLFLMPLYDILQPTELQRLWWQSWNQPPHREYRHGHISVCFSPKLYRDLREFAAEIHAPAGIT